MNYADIEKFLIDAQNQSIQTKMLNAILANAQEIEKVKGMIIDLQVKVNEIIGEWNQTQEEYEDAEALSYDIPSDSTEEDIIDLFADELQEQDDALEEQSPHALDATTEEE